MVGGTNEDVAKVQPIFDALKPPSPTDESGQDVAGDAGFVHAGPVGAGHFSKMVHNGIEYAMMQAYGEGYELLAAVDLIEDVPGVIASWTQGTVIRSWLLDLLVRALQEDPDAGEDRAATPRTPARAGGPSSRPSRTPSRCRRSRPRCSPASSSRQDDSPTMKAVAALRNQFGGHAVQRRASSRRPSAPPDPRPPHHALRAEGPRCTSGTCSSGPSAAGSGWTSPLAPGPTVFVGRNGEGKTNLVEAVGYLATMSSHRVSGDAPLVRHGDAQAVVRAALRRGDRELLVEIEINPGRANRVRVNRAPLPRPRELLGLVRTVLFAPEDLALVRGDPTERRRFLDELLVTRTPRLAGVRADYDRVLKQRNALLKTARLARGKAIETLDVWDGHLTDLGGQLLAARLQLVADLAPHMARGLRRGRRRRRVARPASATPRPCRWPATARRWRPTASLPDGRRADRRDARAGRRAARRRAGPRHDAGRPAPRRPGHPPRAGAGQGLRQPRGVLVAGARRSSWPPSRS